MSESATKSESGEKASNFIRSIIDADNHSGKHQGRVHMRFPPEPNGYLHIGHAKSICLNFGLAREYGGLCNLRFDDTNPSKEELRYVDSMIEDIRWLGFDWGDRLFFASDYFARLYELARQMVEDGLAYVDSLSAAEMRDYRGTLKEPGRNSPHRDRSVAENLDLLGRMKAGEFDEGAHVLRAKIDMAAPNINMRDPVMYRILHAEHHRTGNDWHIYPTYDWTHGQSDSFEGVTHSLCTLEFEDHRPLYEWFLDAAKLPHRPQQIEFARLNLDYTITSKRKLRQLVEEGLVDGWDDPRMPTISGMRRRGIPPAAIRDFCERVGVAKRDGKVDVSMLEFSIRSELNKQAPRVLAVLKPLRVVIENYPEGQTEEFDAVNNPEDASAGTRKVPFSRVLYIERDDFMEEPPRKFFRLGPGREVRLKYAYYITCKEVVKNEAGEIVELRCSYDPESRGGNTPDGRKVRGTIHWVSAEHALTCDVKLYDRLFSVPRPESAQDGKTFLDYLNPESLKLLEGCKLEPGLASASPGSSWQFERLGYFCVDADATDDGTPVFNRTITLRDTWAKIQQTGK